MFLQEDIREFLNKIINQTNLKEKDSVKENILKFRKYLELTQMSDSETLEEIDTIIDCLDELIILKDKLGDVDVTGIFCERKKDDSIKLKKNNKRSLYDKKHYHHYSKSNNYTGDVSEPSYWSSGCSGGGTSYRGGC